MNPVPGSWQVAQLIVPSPDNRRSKKRFFPSATFSGVVGFSGGDGGGGSGASAGGETVSTADEGEGARIAPARSAQNRRAARTELIGSSPPPRRP